MKHAAAPRKEVVAMPITATPQTAPITQSRVIRAVGLSEGVARLVSVMEKTDGSCWASTALFSIGADGILDLARHAPLSGDWKEAESMAPVWSMRRIRAASAPEKSAEPDPVTVHLTLTDASGCVHHGSFTQTYLAPGVTRKDLNHPGLVGTVFFPAGEGPHPVVLGLNGSNGGMPLQRCALYAANGYIAVALAFFGAPGLPEYFGATPLEYFETALAWIRKTLRPKNDFIAVAGSSRGGELAMLLASHFPEYIRAVIGFVPSAVVNGIQQAGAPGEPRDAPAWTWRGEAIPNLWQGNPDADVAGYSRPEVPGTPIRQSRVFMTALRNAAFLEKARIPVERINGPVLMISGGDDGAWPSALFSDMIKNRLEGAGHPWPVLHLSREGAGHMFSFPFVPVEQTVGVSPRSGMIMDRGGTIAENAAFHKDLWPQVEAFLRDAPEIYRQGAAERG